MKKSILIIFTSLYLPFELFAGGFQINLQGQKQSGMAHTGTGLLLDNASVLFNPGSVCFLDSLRGISFGISFIMPRTTYLEPYPGRYKANTENHTGTPLTLYAVYKFKKTDRLSMALGIYNPFGSRVQWADDWKGQFLIREIDLKIFFIQPTLSYKVNSKLGIGAGFIYATGDFSLRKGIPLQNSFGEYGEGVLFGKANGYGFNAGLYFKATEKLSIGIDYRSQVDAKVNRGKANFNVPKSVEPYFPSSPFSTKLKLPKVASLGFGYVLNKKIKLALDINYVGWKSYDSLIVDFAENTDKLADIHSARVYQNVFVFRIGGQYQFKQKITFRLGAYYDMSPVKSGYLTPETPDANKIGLTTGASFNLTKKMHIDFSLLYIEGLKRSDTNLETGFSGSYKSKVVVPGFSFEYMF